ncbi:hypothetical protein ABZ468_50410 [Streptomyces sp. NPDC005708]
MERPGQIVQPISREPVATEVGLLDNLRTVLAAGRQAGLKVTVLDTAA